MMFINCRNAREDHLCTKILLFTSVLTGGICQLFCPELAELGSSAELTCIYPSDKIVTYRAPPGDTPVAACEPEGNCNVIGGDRFSVTNINKTHSQLTITNVLVSDGGEWICEESLSGATSRCTIYPFKTPTCHITSSNDTNNLDIHENISLSVNITNYYCSTPIDFLLQAGNTEEVLIKQTTVEEKNITSDVFNSTFKVTESHIGSMELIFICNNVNETVECGGVQTLQRRPPMCNITANRDAGGLNVGDEITMDVYIEDYSCSRSLEYFLQIGGDTNRLNGTETFNETITVTVKESHFGPVYLNMNCNDVSQNLICDGVKQLRKRQHTTTSTRRPNNGKQCQDGMTSPIPIIAGTVAAVFFLIAVGILLAYFAKVRKYSSTGQSALKDVPYADVSDNVNTRPKSISFSETGAYSEICDINGSLAIKGNDKVSNPDIQMVPNVGYESVDDVRKGLSKSYASGLPQTEPTFNPEVEYSKVNKKRMSQNTAEV